MVIHADVGVVDAVGLNVDGGGHRDSQGVVEFVFDSMCRLVAGGEAYAGFDLDAGGEVQPVALEAESELGYVADAVNGANHRFCAGDQVGVDTVEETSADDPCRRYQ